MSEPCSAADGAASRSALDFASPSSQLLLLSNSDKYRTLSRVLAAISSGKAVLDIGAGSGILSLLAYAHGAKRIVAVERPSVSALTSAVFQRLRVDPARVVLVSSDFFDYGASDLRFDVVICEAIGYLGFEEGIAPIMARAKRLFASSGALFVPSSLRVILRPLSAASPGPAAGRPYLTTIPHEEFPAEAIREPEPLVLGVVDDRPIRLHWRLRARARGQVNGIAMLFEAGLPREGVLTNHPPSVWPYCIIPLDELDVEDGDELEFGLALTLSGAEYIAEVRVLKTGESVETVRFASSGIGTASVLPLHGSNADIVARVVALLGDLGLTERFGL